MRLDAPTPPITVSHRLSVKSEFFSLSIGWLLISMACRFGELIYATSVHGLPGSLVDLLPVSAYADGIYFLQSSFWLFILYFPIALISVRAARFVYVSSCLLLLLIQVSLVMYFVKTSVLLGTDLTSYSRDEVIQVIGASGDVNIVSVITLSVILVLAFVLFQFCIRRMKTDRYGLLALIGLGILTILFDVTSWVPLPHLATEYTNNLAINKTGYMAGVTFDHFMEDDDEGVDIYADSYSGDYGDLPTSAGIRRVNYVAERQYPFLRHDETADVLSPFFRPSAAPPTLVFIVIEGLGSAFCGSDAYLGSFTPFIDSLAQESLYWKNFLSEGGRTFAVLPSLFGSLPFGEHGFSDLGKRLPAHLSLPAILKKNGYQSAFYYGGHAQFDAMATFLRSEGIDRIVDEQTYGPEYQRMPAVNGFTWGYGDKDLYRHYLGVNSPADTNGHPKLQILLTLSTHNPFRINEQARYLKQVDQRMAALSLTTRQRQEKSRYAFQLASILYADDALRQFIAMYSKRPDFGRTIFFITGDHRMPEIPMTTKIDRYHVPFLIYSPLLKRRATFQSISTHFDVTPTVLAFLNKRNNLKIPSMVSWLGTGIDTARNFRNVHAYPLKLSKAELVDFIRGEYLLNQDNLYRINTNMSLSPTNNPGELNRMVEAFNAYKRKNNQFNTTKALVPDSLLRRYN